MVAGGESAEKLLILDQNATGYTLLNPAVLPLVCDANIHPLEVNDMQFSEDPQMIAGRVRPSVQEA
jgi:hypothetical protein